MKAGAGCIARRTNAVGIIWSASAVSMPSSNIVDAGKRKVFSIAT